MTEKPIILALVGPSGSGKTTLSLYLQDKLGIPAICSFTTRPIRAEEVDGREHWFVKECVADISKTLAYTFFGGHHYWTMPEQVEAHRLCTYVIDEKGLLELNTKWGDKYKIVSIYLTRACTDDIAEDRKKRDDERINIALSDYHIILHNDSDLQTLFKQAVYSIAQLISI